MTSSGFVCVLCFFLFHYINKLNMVAHQAFELGATLVQHNVAFVQNVKLSSVLAIVIRY
jgi:hypothetical protein